VSSAPSLKSPSTPQRQRSAPTLRHGKAGRTPARSPKSQWVQAPSGTPQTQDTHHFNRRSFESWSTTPSRLQPGALQVEAVVIDSNHIRRHPEKLKAAEEYAYGTSLDAQHEHHDQLSGRSLAFLQHMQHDSFPYQFLAHALPPPTERPPEQSIESILLHAPPPRHAEPSDRPFGGPFAHTKLRHSFSLVPRWSSETPASDAMLLGPGEYAAPIVQVRQSGPAAKICSRIAHMGGAALSESDAAAARQRGPGAYMPLVVPEGSVKSRSLGMPAIGWYDDRFPLRSGWPRASVLTREAEQQRLVLEAPPPVGSYNPGMSAPSMPCAPHHRGLMWAAPGGANAGRALCTTPSTSESVGPGTYRPPDGGPSQLVHSTTTAFLQGRPIEQADELAARLGPSTYHLPDCPYTTEPQGADGRHVCFAVAPHMAPVRDAATKAAARAKMVQLAEELAVTLSPAGVHVTRERLAQSFEKRDAKIKHAKLRRAEIHRLAEEKLRGETR